VLKQALQAGFEFVRFFLICGENFVRFLIEKFSSFFVGVRANNPNLGKGFVFPAKKETVLVVKQNEIISKETMPHNLSTC